MASLNGFDANTVDPAKPMTPVPAGDYKAAIANSEMKENSKKTGSYLALEFQILDGEHKGRKLYSNLNLNNPNKTAVDIARGELSAICRAVNVMTPNDSAELHNKPMVVTVGLEKRKDTGDMQNRIKGWKPIGEASAQAAAQSAAAAEAGEKAPW